MRKLEATQGTQQPTRLTSESLERFRRGEHARIHQVLGAHVILGEGTRFAVWAPRATRVDLLGDFNGWESACHAMQPRGESGVWELFVPGVGDGARYKFEIRTTSGAPVTKADPLAFAAEPGPYRASIVTAPSPYDWRDAEWLERRSERLVSGRPISIYEVHLGSWRRRPDGGWLSYRELADLLLPYVRDLGFTHVELLPVTEHPFDGSWGYQTTGYFAPTHRFGSPDDLRYLIDEAHRLGLGVVLDWAPAHFPRDSEALARFDGGALYEYADPYRGEHPDWDTAIFDYRCPEVVSFLVSSAVFWLEEYHADALRVDAVASMLYLDYSRQPGKWTPNVYGGRENLEALEFIRHLNETVHRELPGTLMIAEESTAWPGVTNPPGEGGLGFDLKWNMGWMNDTLEFFRTAPPDRRAKHHEITFSLLYAFTERYVLPLSHDEVVHLKRALLEKMPGSREAQHAGLRALYGYMWAHPGRKLLFMGGEFGQRTEWDHDGELQWELAEQAGHRGLRRLVRELNRLYAEEPALHEADDDPAGFEWIDVDDAERSVISFVRWARDRRDFIVVVVNLSHREWPAYRLGLPEEGRYLTVLSTDESRFGGAGQDSGAAGSLEADPASEGDGVAGRPFSLEVRLPPLSALYIKRAD